LPAVFIMVPLRPHPETKSAAPRDAPTRSEHPTGAALPIGPIVGSCPARRNVRCFCLAQGTNKKRAIKSTGRKAIFSTDSKHGLRRVPDLCAPHKPCCHFSRQRRAARTGTAVDATHGQAQQPILQPSRRAPHRRRRHVSPGLRAGPPDEMPTRVDGPEVSAHRPSYLSKFFRSGFGSVRGTAFSFLKIGSFPKNIALAFRRRVAPRRLQSRITL
jgi:hypothetical protein